MPFSPEERARIKYFLKYANWQSMSNGVQLGIPAGSQAMYLVEQSFERLSLDGEQIVREILEQLQAIECQIKDARKRMKATTIGTLRTNQDEAKQLRTELEDWRQRLSDALGAPVNPYTLQNPMGTPGGINARVIG